MQFWDSVDKNRDGATCVIDFFGFDKKAPWYSNIIDNVERFRGSDAWGGEDLNLRPADYESAALTD